MLLDTGATYTHVPRTMFDELVSFFQTKGCKL